MLSLFGAILIYLVTFVFYGFITLAIFKLKLHKKSKLFIVGLVLIWVFTIFNIVYTGIMGWNMFPATELEEFLDAVTFTGTFVGFAIFYTALWKTDSFKVK